MAAPRGRWAASPFLPLLALFVSTRLLALLLLRPGGFFGDWSDYYYYRELAALSSQGYYPYLHFWVEYPPVFPWLVVGAYRLSLLLPAFGHPLLWFQLPLSGFLLLADVGNLWLVRRIGGRLWGEATGLQCAWLYAGLFLPLYALSVWFDTLALFWLLLGLELVLQRRPLLAGLAAGAGVAVKLFPGLVAPVALRALPGWRAWLRFALGGVVAPLAAAAPFALASPAMLAASLRGMLNRGSWESVWALLDGYYGTGVVPALSDRLLYPESALWQSPSRVPWVAVGAAFAAAYLVVWWRARLTLSPSPLAERGPGGEVNPRATVALTAFTVAIFLLYSKGFSQQFTILLLPFVVLLAPTLRGALFAVALTVNDVLVEGYVWVNVFPDDRALLATTVGIRTLLLVLLAVEALGALSPRLGRRWAAAKPAMTGALAALAVALIVFAGARLGAAYWESSAARSPRAGAIAALRATPADTALLFEQEALYAATYPYARPRPALVVADPKLPDRVGAASLHARLAEFAAGRPSVLLATEVGPPASPLDREIRRWLERGYQPAGSQDASGVRLESFAARPHPAFAEPVVFGGAIALDWAELPPAPARAGGELRLLLGWRALAAPGRDYTVFAHLLDGRGGQERIAAQRDSPPLGGHYPTSGWRAGEGVVDELSIPLPPALAEGEYRLAVGLYHQPTGERLPALGGPGAGDRVVLGPLRIAAGP